MANLFKNKAKLILIAYAVLIFCVLLFGLLYMTQYANIHVYYQISQDGSISFARDYSLSSTAKTNSLLFDYFYGALDGPYASSVTGISSSNSKIMPVLTEVYNYQVDMSSFNTLIIIYAVVGLVCFAVMMIFSNHSRVVYYKSNLVVGLVMPMVVIIFSIVMIIKNLGLMSTFTANEDLFKIVSVMQDANISDQVKDTIIDNYSLIAEHSGGVNIATYLVATVLFVLVIAYSVFVMIFTFKKYKDTAERRAKIIERAVSAND